MIERVTPALLERRSVLGAGLALSLVAPLPARAQAKYALKYATNVASNNPLNIRLSEAIGRIKQETDGAVAIELFSDGQLGSDTDMLSQLRSGALEMMTLSSVILSTLVPSCAIVGVGFAFPSYDAIWAAMDGDLGARLRADMAKAGIFAQSRVWDLSFKRTDLLEPSHPDAGRSEGLQAARAAGATVEFAVPRVRRGSDDYQHERDLFVIADEDCRRDRTATDDVLLCEAL